MFSYKDYVWIALILLVFSGALMLQWDGYASIVVADNIHYIVGGVNLIRTGQYTNPFGFAELWFPPLYPALIGLFSLGGRIDPMFVGRLLSVIASLWCLALLYLFSRRHVSFYGRYLPIFSTIILACNPYFQLLAVRCLSQTVATVLLFTAFYVWDSLGQHSLGEEYLWIGLFLGLSYLTRPEALILLPLWILTDRYLFNMNKMFNKYWITVLVFCLCISPYTSYLYNHTGAFLLSNKGEVNVAAGRADFYGKPREYIDPDTLEMDYYNYETTVWSEFLRYATNLYQIFIERKGFGGIFRPMLWPIFLFFAIIGVAYCWYRQKRLCFGLLSLFAYLPVMALYAVEPSYLHATFVALSFFIAVGISYVILVFSKNNQQWAIIVLLCFVSITLLEGASRYPRWTLTEGMPKISLLRDIGRQLASKQLLKGVMYEKGATVVYYSGQLRGRMTPNDLPTLLRYIDRKHASKPVYFVIDSLHQYHPTLKELLSTKSLDFPIVDEINDQRGKVRVLRVK